MNFKKSNVYLVLLLSSALAVSCLSPTGGKRAARIAVETERMAAPVPPDKGAFETGVYRNMFLERGYAADEIQAKVKALYEHLFHGNPDDQAVMYDAANDVYVGASESRKDGQAAGY